MVAIPTTFRLDCLPDLRDKRGKDGVVEEMSFGNYIYLEPEYVVQDLELLNGRRAF